MVLFVTAQHKTEDNVISLATVLLLHWEKAVEFRLSQLMEYIITEYISDSIFFLH